MLRLLHTADWQIGRSYRRFAPDDAAALSEARFIAIETLVRLATDTQCAAVLVAGDVFDLQTVSERTLRRVFQLLAGFSGPWVLLPGNHDAALSESVWSRAQRLGIVPAHVHLALKPEALHFPELKLSVLPAPLLQRHTYDDLTIWFDTAETPADHLRVGLAHGSVQGVLPDDIDSPNPIAAERAARARLDYLALGDWHGCKMIDARTWYSGTPEPERFRDNGAGQALVVALSSPGAEPQVQAHATARHGWHQWAVSLAVASDLEALIVRLDALAAPAVLDLAVTGVLDLAGLERLHGALAAAEARHRSVQADLGGVQLQPTDADLADLAADGYLTDVIATLRDDNDNAVAREALVILAGLLREQRAAGGV